jgi:small multidrug resistance family-3 protein
MSRTSALCVLLLAAILEAGGDAIVRFGLHASPGPTRVGLLGSGAIVLFSYGYLVNTPPWDFGRLLGIYVVFFFVVAQVISWLAFHQAPTRPVYIGGAFIVLGGLILSVG